MSKRITIWAVILTAWISCITEASITRPVIRNSLLSWSSYHAYHCIKMWDGDLLTVYQSRLRTTLKAAESNRRWAKRQARRIVFDLSWMAENFGDGTATLMHQRSQDGLPYAVSAVQDGNTLTWTVTDIDTAFVGYGKAEIRWTVGDALAKTVTYKTRVMESITGDTVVPDPYQSWYDQMVETVTGDIEDIVDDKIADIPATVTASGDGTVTIGVTIGGQ